MIWIWGKTALVKHEIKLKDTTPFKEHYHRILPGINEEVRAHSERMLEIGDIRPSTSPWARPVVHMRKKDGKLHFCIHLRKLNEWTVKDTYSILHVHDTLDVLNGAAWFTSLDLKSGY